MLGPVVTGEQAPAERAIFSGLAGPQISWAGDHLLRMDSIKERARKSVEGVLEIEK